jgi:4-amino-4-deoxy-L-arabinose transferase-like glycosyltransferase
MSGARVLRALVFASLAALVFHTHAFVAFRPIRAKVVESPLAAAGGVVRVTAAGFPQLKDLRPPFAVIARINAAAPGTGRFQIAFDGSPACEREVTGGAPRRVDCDITSGGRAAADGEVIVSGPTTPWRLEYLEIATHHGKSTGANTFYVLPRDFTDYARPWPGSTVAVWLVVAGLLLVRAPRATNRAVRAGSCVLAGLAVLLLGVVQAADLVSDYRLVLAAGTFLLWLAVALASKLWTAARWLGDRVGRGTRVALAAGRARAESFFEGHPALRPTAARLRQTWPWIALVLVVGLFCVPLFVNLGEPEARSDEAIYFYAVDRILDTGDWLTPRSIPDDTAFLEKPPLKFWLVAGGMRLGVLPRDERGQRWLDALFGATGFVYVYFLGRRLAGPLCGLTAVLVLFTLDPLVFEHGLRSNTMEGPVFLCYCGGVYHFARWVEAGAERARGHAIAVAAFFVLGFMTKFVAAVFLPVVCLTALAVRHGGWAKLRSGWRDWLLPALMTVALVAPWFVYEHLRFHQVFWDIIFSAHVMKRFTSSLDPSHIRPWHFYATETWKEIGNAGSRILVTLGFARLTAGALRRQPWLARLVIIWGVVPLVLISLGTSKLLHYAYPFWPPIGLAAGYAVAELARAAFGPRGTAAAAWLGRLVPRRVVEWCAADRWRRSALLVVAGLAAVAAAWTAVSGSFTIVVGGARFGSDTVLWPVLWPLLLALSTLVAAGYLHAVIRLAVAVAVAVLLIIPAQAYSGRLSHAMRVDHPIRAVRDCMATVKQSGALAGSGILSVSADIQHYSYYYYLWRLGDWKINREFLAEEAERRLQTPGEQTPVIVSRGEWETLVRRAGTWDATFPAPDVGLPVQDDPVADAARNALRSGARFNDEIAVLLPGPFQACLPDVLAAAGQPLWKDPAPAPRR